MAAIWGCEGVIVCDSKDMRAKRQVVEGVISQIKLFNAFEGRGLWLYKGGPCRGGGLCIEGAGACPYGQWHTGRKHKRSL